MKKKNKAGRRRVGQPISITLTDEQRIWIDSKIPAGGTRTEVVRGLIEAALMDAEDLGDYCRHCRIMIDARSGMTIHKLGCKSHLR